MQWAIKKLINLKCFFVLKSTINSSVTAQKLLVLGLIIGKIALHMKHILLTHRSNWNYNCTYKNIVLYLENDILQDKMIWGGDEKHN